MPIIGIVGTYLRSAVAVIGIRFKLDVMAVFPAVPSIFQF